MLMIAAILPGSIFKNFNLGLCWLYCTAGWRHEI